MGTDKDKFIHIAFCFDKNMMRQACVAVASLLSFRDRETHFHIYCVCPDKAFAIQDTLRRIVAKKDSQSSIFFHRNTMNLDKGFEIRGITVSTYYRLNLHRMFPQINRMIYADVDILFQDDLMPVWETDIGENLLAGVKADVNIKEVWERHYEDEYWSRLDDWFGNYINAGFLLMNLEEIRKRHMEKAWKGMHENRFFFQDQDILNLTCKPDITHLPMRFNRMMFYTDEELCLLKRYKVVRWMELEEAIDSPAVIHYAGTKPWDKYGVNGAELWWRYVLKDEGLKRLFRKEAIQYKIYSLFKRIGRRFEKEDC